MKNSNGSLPHDLGLNGLEQIPSIDATDLLPTDAGLCHEHIRQIYLSQLLPLTAEGFQVPEDEFIDDLIPNSDACAYRMGYVRLLIRIVFR